MAEGWEKRLPVLNFLFNPNGRINRLDIWVKFLLPVLGLSLLAGMLDRSSFPDTIWLGRWRPAMLALNLACLWPSIAVSVKRLHDRGVSGWWAVAVNLASAVYSFGLYPSLSRAGSASLTSMVAVGLAIAISIIALVQLVILYFLPGQKTSNKYGPDPLNPTGEAEVFS